MATTTDFFKVVFGADDELSGPMANIAVGAAKMLGGFLAIQKLGDFLDGSVDAARESQAAWNDLAASVRRHEGVWDDYRETFQAFASEMQTVTGESDEVIAKSLALFLDFGSTGQEAMELVRTSADLARGANINLWSSVQLLSKASAGATEMLGRYGIRVDENLSKADKFAAALDLIGERFGGAAAAGMDTADTKLRVLNERWGDFQELVGEAVLMGVNPMIESLSDLLGIITSQEPNYQRFFVTTEGLAQAFADQSLRVAEAQKAIDEYLKGLKGAGETADGVMPKLDGLFDSTATEAAVSSLESLDATARDVIGGQRAVADALNTVAGTASQAGFGIKKLGDESIVATPKTGELDKALQALIEKNDEWNFSMMQSEDGFTIVNKGLRETVEWIEEYRKSVQQGDMDQLSRIFDAAREVAKADAEAADEVIEKAKEHQDEWVEFTLASTGQLTSEVAGLFVGLETDLKAVFRNIAKDYIALVLNEILKQTAIQLGQELFGLLFPGTSALIPIGGAVGTGALGKVGASGATGAGVTNNYYNGVFVGMDEFVSGEGGLEPRLQRRAEFGLNKIALTGTI